MSEAEETVNLQEKQEQDTNILTMDMYRRTIKTAIAITVFTLFTLQFILFYFGILFSFINTFTVLTMPIASVAEGFGIIIQYRISELIGIFGIIGLIYQYLRHKFTY